MKNEKAKEIFQAIKTVCKELESEKISSGMTSFYIYEDEKIHIGFSSDGSFESCLVRLKLSTELEVFGMYETAMGMNVRTKVKIHKSGKWEEYLMNVLLPKAKQKQAELFSPVDDSELFSN